MTEHDSEAVREFDDEIARLKADERRAEKQIRLTALLLWIAGLVAGAGYYHYAIPVDRGMSHQLYAVGMGLTCVWVLGLIRQLLLPELGARCPKCQQPWVRDEETGDDWKTWRHCPGCGLKMDGR